MDALYTMGRSALREGMTMGTYKVVITDQVFPTTDLEASLLAGIGASLEVADGTLEDVLARGSDADALLTTYFPITAETVAGLACGT